MTELQQYRNVKGVKQIEVARFFKGGVSRQRISFVEAIENPPADICRDFKRAVDEATEFRSRLESLYMRLMPGEAGREAFRESVNGLEDSTRQTAAES